MASYRSNNSFPFMPSQVKTLESLGFGYPLTYPPVCLPMTLK